MTDDGEVIRRVLKGEVSSFRVLVERYQGPLLALLHNLLSDSGDCEDVAQEVFLAAYHALATYRPELSRFSTWLFTIARNKCVNLLQKRRPIVVRDLPEEADARTPDLALAEREFFHQLDAALAGLPFDQKAAFVLAEIHGLSYEEIARMEAVSVGTVKSRLSRAKEKLRTAFERTAEQTG